MNLTECEKDIAKYIDNNEESDYADILANDTRWEVFYHFCEMRKSILNWYGFKEDSKLLEIGGEFGALTGLFCERCKEVVCVELNEEKSAAIKKRHSKYQSLMVITDLGNALVDKYDYIVLIGGLERVVEGKGTREDYAHFLEKIGKSLKFDGKLLIAVENRLGMKYFCGYRERYSGIPFAGINGNEVACNGYTFSKAEFEDILNRAGLDKYKFFYPLPDYKLTQLIYTDDNLPSNSIRDKVINYYVDKSTLISCEDNMYDDIIENGMLPFMANSFLVEVSLNDEFSKASYVALSTDRIKSEAFATVVYGRNIVYKIPLYSEGIQTAKALCRNIEDIQKHGLKVVPHSMEDNNVVMPYLNGKPLMYYLQNVIHKNPQRVFELLDLLYNTVLQSSEHVSSEDNALPYEGTEVYDFGVILKYAYIDMIPYNCFYIQDDLVFYDQEFRRENYPAGYVIFRALWYTYNFIPDFSQYISLNKLKEHFHLTELWDIYMREEERFIEQNRNHKVMKSFYNWISVDKSQFYRERVQ